MKKMFIVLPLLFAVAFVCTGCSDGASSDEAIIVDDSSPPPLIDYADIVPVEEVPIVVVDEVDTDGDGIIDKLDNCVDVANTDQMDTDLDAIGDACVPKPDDEVVVVDDNEELPGISDLPSKKIELNYNHDGIKFDHSADITHSFRDKYDAIIKAKDNNEADKDIVTMNSDSFVEMGSNPLTINYCRANPTNCNSMKIKPGSETIIQQQQTTDVIKEKINK